MEVLYLLHIMNAITTVFLQTSGPFAVHQIAQMNKKLERNLITCLHKLSLGACALECLLVKRCKSFNHMADHGMVCELNSVTHDEAYALDLVVDSNGYVLVDIRDWPEEVAGTCASRPCAANQRCLPVSSHRCIDIDCGTPPPVLPREDDDTNMHYVPATSSLGSIARYECLDSAKVVVSVNAWNGFVCIESDVRICNSNSQWTLNRLACL